MKTTNYEISKKLREIGFETETIFYYEYEELRWEEEGVDLPFEDLIYAYDLETILEAFPKVLGKFRYWSTWSTSSNCYIFGYVNGVTRNTALETNTENNESLADTAARLLIKLIEDKIIKIK